MKTLFALGALIAIPATLLSAQIEPDRTAAAVRFAETPQWVTYIDGGDEEPVDNDEAFEQLAVELVGVRRVAIDTGGNAADEAELSKLLREKGLQIVDKTASPDLLIEFSGQILQDPKRRAGTGRIVSIRGEVRTEAFRYKLPEERYRVGDTPIQSFTTVLSRAMNPNNRAVKRAIAEASPDARHHFLAAYDLKLRSVERSSSGSEPLSFSEVLDDHFSDEVIEINWTDTRDQLLFTLKNRSAGSLKIIWDEASYTDEIGSGHRVIHAGVKYVDRSSAMPVSVVARKAQLDDLVAPSDGVHWIEGRWAHAPLFPAVLQKGPETRATINERASRLAGKTVSVLLPIEAGGVRHEYLFTFEIAGVTLHKAGQRTFRLAETLRDLFFRR